MIKMYKSNTCFYPTVFVSIPQIELSVEVINRKQSNLSTAITNTELDLCLPQGKLKPRGLRPLIFIYIQTTGSDRKYLSLSCRWCNRTNNPPNLDRNSIGIKLLPQKPPLITSTIRQCYSMVLAMVMVLVLLNDWPLIIIPLAVLQGLLLLRSVEQLTSLMILVI